jgi:hypothetical protein
VCVRGSRSPGSLGRSGRAADTDGPRAGAAVAPTTSGAYGTGSVAKTTRNEFAGKPYEATPLGPRINVNAAEPLAGDGRLRNEEAAPRQGQRSDRAAEPNRRDDGSGMSTSPTPEMVDIVHVVREQRCADPMDRAVTLTTTELATGTFVGQTPAS